MIVGMAGNGWFKEGMANFFSWGRILTNQAAKEKCVYV